VCAAAVRAFVFDSAGVKPRIKANSTEEVEEALEGHILWCQLPLHQKSINTKSAQFCRRTL